MRVNSIAVTALCIVIALGLGYVDYLTGPELAFSIFYLLPVMLGTWYAGTAGGVVVSFVSTVIWLYADLMWDHPYEYADVPYWNSATRLAFFLVVLLLLKVIRRELDRRANEAFTDHLTGLANSRRLAEYLAVEIARSQRQDSPLTIAYLDLDNFKQANDRHGHIAGDGILQEIGRVLSAFARQTDLAARIGGDEFVVVMPGVTKSDAGSTVGRLHDHLSRSLQDSGHGVTCSIGAVTFGNLHLAPDDIIRMADDAMYEAKRNGRNKVVFASHERSQPDRFS